MRRTIDVWDALKRQDRDLHVPPAPISGGLSWWTPGTSGLAEIRVGTGSGDPGSLGLDATQLAIRFVEQVLTERMAALVSPRLVWNPDTSRMRLLHLPATLIGTLWQQFALATAGDKTFRDCKYCQVPYEISLDTPGRRADSEFCSTKCKSADYRARQKMARELAALGESPGAIAPMVGSDEKTVRGWLKPPSRRRLPRRPQP